MAKASKHPPYHLRTNKAVDRLLLVKAIYDLGSEKYSKANYYTLSGPYLEDLRLMDHFFPEMRLTSLEKDNETYKRQEFHRFNSRLILKGIALKDFLIQEYEPGDIDIFWLDFTGLSPDLFDEFQMVLKRVPSGSIVRITLRAEPDLDVRSLETLLPDEIILEMKKKLNDDFYEKFRMLLPIPAPEIFTNREGFALVVQHMVKQAASEALDTSGSTVDFLPIQSTRYNDNTQMLSMTGVVCERDQIENLKEKLRSKKYANCEWNEPTFINIPALSLKERLFLEKHLPVPSDKNAGDLLFEVLNYMIDTNISSSKEQLAHYADYHQDYPNFIRVMF